MPHQRFPKVEILSIEPHEIRFLLSETCTSMANTLRRIMIAEVPTLAIDLVEFYENSTVLNDEYIAHRLGLIPLRYQAPDSLRGGDCHAHGAFLPHYECVCHDGCPRCMVQFELDVDFDRDFAKKRNSTDDEEDMGLMPSLVVTSVDLVSQNDCVTPAHFISPKEADDSHDSGISIVKMGSGQHLHLKAWARTGISKEHAKWCPVAVATYRFYPEIYLNEQALGTLTMEQKMELVEVCPDQILELDEVTGKLSICDYVEECATFTEDLKITQCAMKKKPEDEDFVTVKQSTDRFIFTVESTGAMDAEEILMSSLRVLKDRLNYLALEVQNLKD